MVLSIPVFSKTYQEKVPVVNYQAGMQQVVAAWDQGLVTIIGELNKEWAKL